jgi:hypothetical protein
MTFGYRPMFDTACAEAIKRQGEPEAVKELQSRLESFRDILRQESPELVYSVRPTQELFCG